MLEQLKGIVPGFEINLQTTNKILIEDSNSCSGEWMTYGILEMHMRNI